MDFNLDEDAIAQAIEEVTKEIKTKKHPYGFQNPSLFYKYGSLEDETKSYKEAYYPTNTSTKNTKNYVSGKHVKGGLISKIPALSEYETKCPVELDCKRSYNKYPLSSIIIHLNDLHKWTREEIADWLESLPVDLRFKVE